jgi:ribosome-associated protein YbcJ (S4-like RNA binding protein)
MREFQLKSDYIELVEEGEVFLNGNQEFRKRAKLRHGDTITVLGETIRIVSQKE